MVSTSTPGRFFPSPFKFTRAEGVRGVIILDNEGHPIQSDFDLETTKNVATQILPLISSARGVIASLNESDMKIVRLKINKGEVIMFLDDAGLIYIMLKLSESTAF